MVMAGGAEYVFFPPACVGFAAGVLAVEADAAAVDDGAFVAADVAAPDAGVVPASGVTDFLLPPPQAAARSVAPSAQMISGRM